MKIALATVLIGLLGTSVWAQPKIGLEVNTGYSTYAMSDLRELTESYQQRHQADYPVKITANFPGFVTFGANGFVAIQQFDIGVGYTYYSTGARSQYQDYSGEAGFDQYAKANAFSFFGRCRLVEGDHYVLSVQISASYYSSRLTMREYLRVGRVDYDFDVDTKSSSFGMTPSLSMAFKINKQFQTGIRIGHHFDNKGSLYLSDDPDTKVRDRYGNLVRTDWTGLRSELFVMYKY